MIFAYDFDRLNTFLKAVLQKNLTSQAWQWLEQEGNAVKAKGDVTKFNIAFVAMPRKTGKELIKISPDEESELKTIREGFTIRGWTCDRLGRVWLLLMLSPEPKEKYIATIENLFLSAEMSELVALYSALPVLAYPGLWHKRCAEGIRNNIGQVLEAVICNNPYPSEELDEAAWNQLVLKALFTDKPVLEIIGLRKRRNKNLALSLYDYVHERWAAHREVNPLLWICMTPFVDSVVFADLERLFLSADVRERHAAALVCYESSYGPAKELLGKDPKTKEEIERGLINWEKIANQFSN